VVHCVYIARACCAEAWLNFHLKRSDHITDALVSDVHCRLYTSAIKLRCSYVQGSAWHSTAAVSWTICPRAADLPAGSIRSASISRRPYMVVPTFKRSSVAAWPDLSALWFLDRRVQSINQSIFCTASARTTDWVMSVNYTKIWLHAGIKKTF